MTYCAPFPASVVTNWNENLLNCAIGEWGVDVGLPAGTTIVAPFAANILSWWPCCAGCTGTCYCWGCASDSGCGRIALGYGPRGEAVAFGHLKPLVTSGHVSCGQPIGVVQQDACGGPHTEFQYFPDGNPNSCSSAVDPRAYLQMLEASGSSSPPPPSPPPIKVEPGLTFTQTAVGGGLLLLAGGIGLIGWTAMEHPETLRRYRAGLEHEAEKLRRL